GEYVAQVERARFFERPRHQARADSLTLESRDRVEADELADVFIAVRVDLQRADAGEVMRADLRTEAVDQDARHLGRRARFEEPLALAAGDEPLDFLEVVDAEPFDAAVVLAREERAGA